MAYDQFAATWSSPVIVGNRVYVCDEDGDVTFFKLSATKNLLDEINMGSAVYPTPAVANNTLFIAAKNRLLAIRTQHR